MTEPPTEKSYTLDNVPCPRCGELLDHEAVNETIDYWDSVGDVKCNRCLADCHVSTTVTRRASAEPSTQDSCEDSCEVPKPALWFVETADAQLSTRAATAGEAAAIVLIKRHNAREPIGRVISVSRHGFGGNFHDDVYFSTEKVLQEMAKIPGPIPEPSHPPTVEPPTRNLSRDAAQDLRAFLAAFVSAWDSIYQVPTNPYLPMSSLYVQAKSLAKQIEA